MEIKNEIINILKDNVKRDGIENLIYYIQECTDFFTAPSSTKFHGNKVGGLAEHSFNVYNLLKEKVARYGIPTDIASITICGLLHDITKTNFYIREKKWVKENGKWEQKEIWGIKDMLPLGHGEKSVMILQKFISLTDEEMICIRWHLGGFDPGIQFNYPSGFAYRQAIKEYPLLALMVTADMEASYMLEETLEE